MTVKRRRVVEPSPFMKTIVQQNTEMKNLVEKLLNDDDKENNGGDERGLIVETIRVKLRRVVDARLDDLQEDLSRLLKFYISNPEPGVRLLDD